jgi:hypothetical protein
VTKKHAMAFSLAVCIPFVVTARTRAEHFAVVPSRRHLIDVSAVHGVRRAAVGKTPSNTKGKRSLSDQADPPPQSTTALIEHL